jgi:hypothetical protein
MRPAVARDALLAAHGGLSLELCAVLYHISPMALYVSGRVLWHLGYTEEASATAFTQSYREFQRAASHRSRRIGSEGGLGHITVDTCGNLEFHIFLLA